MSRVGRVPVTVPADVQVTIDGHHISTKGPKGQLERTLHPDISIKMEDHTIVVTRPSDDSYHRSLHGLTRSLVSNMVVGVSKGFEKSLEIRGVGYRGQLNGKNLVLQLGYSHPIELTPPETISFAVEGPRVSVLGADKQLVGEVAAKIRELRPAEPYQGKGIRYVGETIRRKAGKSGKAGERG